MVDIGVDSTMHPASHAVDHRGCSWPRGPAADNISHELESCSQFLLPELSLLSCSGAQEEWPSSGVGVCFVHGILMSLQWLNEFVI